MSYGKFCITEDDVLISIHIYISCGHCQPASGRYIAECGWLKIKPAFVFRIYEAFFR